MALKFKYLKICNTLIYTDQLFGMYKVTQKHIANRFNTWKEGVFDSGNIFRRTALYVHYFKINHLEKRRFQKNGFCRDSFDVLHIKNILLSICLLIGINRHFIIR